jgi:iron complex transport system permease protein
MGIRLVIIASGVPAVIAALLLSLSYGEADTGIRDILRAVFLPIECQDADFFWKSYIIIDLRLPRVLMAAIAGMNLSLSGLVMQNILKNPLADPYTLGVASSAAFGAALYIVMGKSVLGMGLRPGDSFLIAANAFLFSLVSLGAVLMIVSLNKHSNLSVLLGGVATGGVFAAGLSLLKYFSANDALKNLELWLLGGFWGASYSNLFVMFMISLTIWPVLYGLAWKLNAIAAGDEVASTLGVNVRVVGYVAIILATLLAAGTIAFSGIIGFVGLVCPFLARGLVGTDNRYLIPASLLIGGLLLTLADLGARIVLSPREIPVGVVTTLSGTPFFIYMLARRKVW